MKGWPETSLHHHTVLGLSDAPERVPPRESFISTTGFLLATLLLPGGAGTHIPGQSAASIAPACGSLRPSRTWLVDAWGCSFHGTCRGTILDVGCLLHAIGASQLPNATACMRCSAASRSCEPRRSRTRSCRECTCLATLPGWCGRGEGLAGTPVRRASPNVAARESMARKGLLVKHWTPLGSGRSPDLSNLLNCSVMSTGQASAEMFKLSEPKLGASTLILGIYFGFFPSLYSRNAHFHPECVGSVRAYLVSCRIPTC